MDMARSETPFGITGSLDEYSLYRMRGVEKVIVRKKGGPDAKKMKSDKNFVNVRRNNAEFGAAAKAGAEIRWAIQPVTHVAEPFFSGKINALATKICRLDETNEWGERQILISKHRHLLEGMNLNSKLVFYSVMRQPVPVEFDRDNGYATVHIPALIPAVNFFVPSQFPLYQFTVSLGVIRDVSFGNEKHELAGNKKYSTEMMRTDWYPSRSEHEAMEIKLQLNNFTKLEEGQTMILAMAIDFGNPSTANIAERIKYAGSGAVIAMG